MNATFWVISILMVFVSLGMILPSILRKPKFGAEDLRVQNVLIAKEKLKELEVELKTERVTPELYAKRKEELEAALLYDTEATTETGQSTISTAINDVEHSPEAAWVIALITPVLAVVLYIVLGTSAEQLNNPNVAMSGNSNQFAGQQAGGAQQQPQISPEEMAKQLSERLKEEPGNAEAWAMLGQTYMQLKNYLDAAAAFDQSNTLKPNNPPVMFRYADALAMANNSSLEGEPIKLINAALKLAPRDMTGLWLSGMYAEQHDDNKTALKHWATLYEVVNGGQYEQTVMEMLTRVNNNVAKADQIDLVSLREKVSATAPATNTGVAAVKVTISIDDSIKSKVAATDIVFIYAKAMSGPPMPLAAVKKQVKDLPITITLDDAMAMMPAMKLSKFKTVKIGAKISKSGSATNLAGDIKQEVANVNTTNASTVNLVLGGIAGSSRIMGSGSRSNAASGSNQASNQASNQVSNQSANNATPGRDIKLKVELDPSLRNLVSDTDVVFIYAKAMSGPKMPLAVVKRQVKDLPLYIALDDSMAMMAQFKLTNFDTVKVGARVSKSGGVESSDGDLFIEIPNISTDGNQAVTLTINQVRGGASAAAAKVMPVALVSSQTPAANSKPSIQVKVTLNDALKTKASPEDSIFIYAKAMQGPPMPLAVVRKQVKDLPITVTLDDAMAMIPTMKLSKFSKVRIGARISKSGNAIAQSGDLFNEISNISNSRSELLSIQINQEKP